MTAQSPKTEISWESRAIGDILGLALCLRYLQDTAAFQDWLESHHGSDMNSELLAGYRLTIETLAGTLHHELALNQSLKLTEDRVFSRGDFAGVPLQKLPNSCEKSIILRNLWFEARPILEAEDWDTLREALNSFWDRFIGPLANLAHVATVTPNPHTTSVDVAQKAAAMFQLYIFLNDTGRGAPHGYVVAPNVGKTTSRGWGWSSKDRHALNRAFDGYKYAVQFLWYCLLGEKFSATPAAALHIATNWDEFDRFFDYIKREIIEPLEAVTRFGLGFDSMLQLQEPAKNSLGSLISDGPPDSRLSPRDALDRQFLWYPIQLIDGSDFNFAGVAAFVPLLVGMVRLRRELKLDGKVQVVRLVHGSPVDHRRDYSYAMLVDVGGILSDSSGWMLFYDCCSDGGSSSSLYDEAEKHIKRYVRSGIVEVSERSIGKATFLKSMKHRLRSLTKDQIFRSRRAK